MAPRIGFRKGLPVAPSMQPAISNATPRRSGRLDQRGIYISLLSICIGTAAAGLAFVLTHLIGFFTNFFFYHQISFQFVDPGDAPGWGPWVIGMPVLGGLIVGLMARYGSSSIRGHGIPEAMEQILTNQSRIPWKIVS